MVTKKSDVFHTKYMENHGDFQLHIQFNDDTRNIRTQHNKKKLALHWLGRESLGIEPATLDGDIMKSGVQASRHGRRHVLQSRKPNNLLEELPVVVELWLVVDMVPVGSQREALHTLQVREPAPCPRSVTSGAGAGIFLP